MITEAPAESEDRLSDYVTVAEAAKIRHTTAHAIIHRLNRNGITGATKLGWQWLIPRASLHEIPYRNGQSA